MSLGLPTLAALFIMGFVCLSCGIMDYLPFPWAYLAAILAFGAAVALWIVGLKESYVPEGEHVELTGESVLGCVLENRIGEGGFGEVFRARASWFTVGMGREKYVVKITRTNILAGGLYAKHAPQVIESYRREYAALRHFQHMRGIPRAYRCDTFQDHLGRTRFGIVQELMYGETLYSELQRRTRKASATANEPLGGSEDALTLKDLLTIMRRLTALVGRIHRRGYCHLDIKSENILISRRGGHGSVTYPIKDVSLVDFGNAARIIGSKGRPGVAKVEWPAASREYSAPEYMELFHANKKGYVTPAADLYSLGIVFGELLMGKPGKHRLMDIYKVASARYPQIPPELWDLLHRLQADKPDDRPKTAAEVEQSLKFVEKEMRNRVGGTLSGIPLGGAAFPFFFLVSLLMVPAPSKAQSTTPSAPRPPLVNERGGEVQEAAKQEPPKAQEPQDPKRPEEKKTDEKKDPPKKPETPAILPAMEAEQDGDIRSLVFTPDGSAVIMGVYRPNPDDEKQKEFGGLIYQKLERMDSVSGKPLVAPLGCRVVVPEELGGNSIPLRNVTTISLNQKGEMLAVAQTTAEVILLKVSDLAKGDIPRVTRLPAPNFLKDQPVYANGATFHPSKKWVAVAYGNGQALVWDYGAEKAPAQRLEFAVQLSEPALIATFANGSEHTLLTSFGWGKSGVLIEDRENAGQIRWPLTHETEYIEDVDFLPQTENKRLSLLSITATESKLWTLKPSEKPGEWGKWESSGSFPLDKKLGNAQALTVAGNPAKCWIAVGYRKKEGASVVLIRATFDKEKDAWQFTPNPPIPLPGTLGDIALDKDGTHLAVITRTGGKSKLAVYEVKE